MYGNPYYYGTTFQPYPLQQNPQMIQPTGQQPMQSQMQQQQPPQQTNPEERIWVQGEEAAKAYLVAPNSFVRLWDSNNNIFYEKSADQSGRPFMQAYEYAPRTATAPKPVVSEQSGLSATMDYAREIEALKRRIQALEQMRSEVATDE